MKTKTTLMALAVLITGSFTFAAAQDDAKKGKNRNNRRGGLLQAFDKNKDGKLTKDELPERAQSRFAAMDSNKDGVIDKEEIAKIAAMRGQGGQRGQRPGGGNVSLNFEEIIASMDKNDDGVLDKKEQQALAARLKQIASRMSGRGPGGRPGDGNPRAKKGQKGKRPGADADSTEPVKPKRPGRE